MDIHRRDLALIASLDVLLAERNVTAAAKRLGISQPALSAQLSRLREMFEDELLVGNAHGMVLTPRAQAMQLPLKAALEDLRAAVSTTSSFDPATGIRHYRIAGSDLAHVHLLPRLLPLLAARAPGLSVEAVPLAPDQIPARMERGEIDFAITSAENAPQAFPARRLINQDFCVIWRQDHPILSAAPTLEQFCALKHVVALVQGDALDRVDAVLQERDLSRQVGAKVPNFLLIPPIIQASDMISVVPKLLAETPGLVVSAGPPPIPLPGFAAYLSWHRRLHQDPACRWFRELIAEIAPQQC
jgi:DNA-binding transcriptional LysR family regulator